MAVGAEEEGAALLCSATSTDLRERESSGDGNLATAAAAVIWAGPVRRLGRRGRPNASRNYLPVTLTVPRRGCSRGPLVRSERREGEEGAGIVAALGCRPVRMSLRSVAAADGPLAFFSRRRGFGGKAEGGFAARRGAVWGGGMFQKGLCVVREVGR